MNSASDESLTSAGAAYVFVRSGTTWTQHAYLKASNTGEFDGFGQSVGVSGDTVVVGAQREDSGTTGVDSSSDENVLDAGAAYVFVRSGTSWSEQAYLKASNPGRNALFGNSVSISGDAVVVGAHFEDSLTIGVNSTPNEDGEKVGAAYLFVRSGSTWRQRAYLKAGFARSEHNFGSSVAVSGDTVVAGAMEEGSGTTGVNSLPDESASSAGATYILSLIHI